MATEERVEEATFEVAGQKVSLKSVALNTFVTLISMIGIIILAALMYTHVGEARDTTNNFLAAVKEQTQATKESAQAQREQNCLLRFEQKDRGDKAEFCKTIS